MKKSKLLFEGKYELLINGIVISHTKHSKGAEIKQRISMHGYWKVPLYINGKQKLFSVHRLLAQAFISNPNNYPCVNHINGVKTDNRLDNLEWCTHSYNTLHGYKIGTNRFSDKQKKQYSDRMSAKTGALAHRAKKVTDGIIVFDTIKQASEHYNIKHKTLSAILNGQIKNKTNLKLI